MNNEFSNPYIVQNKAPLKYNNILLPKEIVPNGFSQIFLNSNPSNMFYKIQRFMKDKDEDTCCILKKVFLSNDNLKIIQKQLVLNVYRKSNKKYKIPFQDERKVIIVMKHMYETYGTNLPFKIKEQVKDLNLKVVEELTPSIIVNLDSYYKYLEDASTQPLGPPLPISLSSKGLNQLPSISSKFQMP